MLTDYEVRICGLWMQHPTIYGICSGKLVALFGERGREIWDLDIWKVSIPKTSLVQ